MYGITLRNGKRRAAKKPKLTAGFKCAPEISPTVYIIASTIRPNVNEIPTLRNRTAAGLVDYDCARSSEHECKRTDKLCSAFFHRNNRQSPVRVFFCSLRSNNKKDMNFFAVATAAVAAELQ